MAIESAVLALEVIVVLPSQPHLSSLYGQLLSFHRSYQTELIAAHEVYERALYYTLGYCVDNLAFAYVDA